MIVFAGIGMVTGCVFTDVDDDSDPDLVLACEWGSLRLLLNQSGRFEDVTAGWVGFGVFLLLVLAVVLLGMSLVRHLRKARVNADMGFFDPSDKPRPHSS